VYPYLGVDLGPPAGLQLVETSQGDEFRFHPARVTGPSQIGALFPVHPAAGGRTRAKFEFEVVTQNELFTKAPTSTSGAVTFPTSPPGVPPTAVSAIVNLPQALPGRGLKVRGRWATPSPFFRHSRWFAPEAHTSGDYDVWLQGTAVGVPGSGASVTEGLRVVAVSPNPAVGKSSATRVTFSLPHAGSVTLEVFDVRGVRVRRVLDEVRPAGPSSGAWDGRDDAGRVAPSGVYYVVVRNAGEKAGTRIVRLH
jgi:hypothetical protein